ncbi:MAG: large subunit ribosomal protein L6 [Flavobacteriales bacterium]|jgi:large subunit ribosomal protein L6
MSRIGKKPVEIPAGVEVTLSNDNLITVKGKLGSLTQQVDKDITVTITDNIITFARPSDQKDHRALHGLYRSLVYNMIEGVAKAWSKDLELVGVGYRATNQGQKLDLSVGYSHNIILELPEEVKIETVSDKGKNPIIKLTSFDKQLIGMIAAKIRAFRKPEPYKGKGIKYVGEQIRRKAGKTAAK